MRTVAETFGLSSPTPGTVVRGLIGIALGSVALWVARKPLGSSEDLMTRALMVTGAMFLLSPAQFPWYYLWVLPLLALVPVTGLLLATVTLPLYYTAFHYLARDAVEVFSGMIVWAVWLPVWSALFVTCCVTWNRQRIERTAASAPAAGAGP